MYRILTRPSVPVGGRGVGVRPEVHPRGKSLELRGLPEYQGIVEGVEPTDDREQERRQDGGAA